jgi:hypothetical protein
MRCTVWGTTVAPLLMVSERWHQPGLTMGIRPDVIERQLAHEEKNAVRAAYNPAEYLNERRAMINQWADYMDALSGGNIVPFNANTKVR